jgi:hypothetical protein
MSFVVSESVFADKPVTYWNEQPIPTVWQKYLNPDHIEFWQEGHYTPPTPLILAMRNPTPENIHLYKTFMSRRASLMQGFEEAMKKEQVDRIESIVIAIRSDCHACEKLLNELSAHNSIKDKIQLLQVDQARAVFPWSYKKLSPSEAEKLQINMVPVVWVKTKTSSYTRLVDPSKLFEEYL